MTLTAALQAALADPADLEPLHALAGDGHIANAIACALTPPVDDDRGRRAVRAVMALDAGAPIADVRVVVHDGDPRSAEWAAAALRLAAWADGQATRDLRQRATPGTVEIAGQTFAAKVTLPERLPITITLDAEATSDGEHTIPVTMTLAYETMRIFALVALDGSGVHGLGADLNAARAHALSTRDDGDPAWLDTLRVVTLSGEPAAVQALVEALSSVPAGGDVWEGT